MPTPKQAAGERYAAVGEGWMAEFGVSLKGIRTGLTGQAWVEERAIYAPWPSTTRNRLYILAHEIGHVALDHRSQRPVYVQEFEAEQFAHGLMRRDGLAVPRKMADRAKCYVRFKIRRAHNRFVRWIDPDIAKWAGTSAVGINWSAEPKRHKHYHAASLRRVRKAVVKS
jgi:hypothetical protein